MGGVGDRKRRDIADPIRLTDGRLTGEPGRAADVTPDATFDACNTILAPGLSRHSSIRDISPVDSFIFAAVLAAAAMHAGWNAVVKIGLDRFATVTLIALASGLVAAPCLLLTGLPAWPAVPFLFASMFAHVGYNLFLARAYQAGDMAQVYPLARGAAPLIVTLISLFFLADPLDVTHLTGVVVLVLGIWLIAVRGGTGALRLNRHAVGSALVTSLFIAAYTLIDGLGARRAGSANAYAATLFVMDGLAMLPVALGVRGVPIFTAMRPEALRGLFGGALSLAAYWISIWAMARAPIATVAALRETSILFALLIALVFLGERLTPWRIVSAMVIVAGIILLRL